MQGAGSVPITVPRGEARSIRCTVHRRRWRGADNATLVVARRYVSSRPIFIPGGFCMATQTRAERKTRPRSVARPAGRRLSDDAPLAPAGRPRDPAQAPEQDLLPDLGRGPRGGALRRGNGAEAGSRLVLPLLPRSGPVPGARRHARRDAVRGRRRREGSRLRRPADAQPLGQRTAQHRVGVVTDGNAVPARRRERRGIAARAAARDHRGISRRRGGARLRG